MYGRKRSINSYSQQCSEDEHDENSNAKFVMLVVHNLDHMMQPQEWETLLTREIHSARILGVSVIREQCLTRPWNEGELTAYIFTRHDASLVRQYLHNRRLGFRRLHVDTVTSQNGIDVFLIHKIVQLLKLNPHMSDIAIEQRIHSFFRRIPSTIRSHDYDRRATMRLIHECMSLPASPPATSEDSEVDSDSPPKRSKCNIPSKSSLFNPQLIRIDEHTMQLHFTPFYFELLETINNSTKNQYDPFIGC